METLYIDGFDDYATADLNAQGWTLGGSVSINTATKRNGASSLKHATSTAFSQRSLGMQARTVVVGVAVYPTAFNTGAKGVFFLGAGNLDSSGGQIAVGVNPSGTLFVYRGYNGSGIGTPTGGATLGTTTTTLSLNTWTHIEFRAYIDDTAGEWELKINGVTEISGTGADTKQSSSNNYADILQLYGAASDWYFDDLYVRGDTALAAGGFQGDCKVLSRMPQGAGSSTQFTPSAGANWAAVDEATPNGDTDYVSSNTAGNRDLYDVAALAAGSVAIKAVQLTAVARKEDAGSRSIKLVAKSGATTSVGTAQALSIGYLAKHRILETDPDTAAAWTESGLDAAEFGFDVS